MNVVYYLTQASLSCGIIYSKVMEQDDGKSQAYVLLFARCGVVPVRSADIFFPAVPQDLAPFIYTAPASDLNSEKNPEDTVITHCILRFSIGISGP